MLAAIPAESKNETAQIEYEPSVVKLIENFTQEIETPASNYFGIKPEAVVVIQEQLSDIGIMPPKTDLKKMRTYCADLKPELQKFVYAGTEADAEISLFTGTVEVDISKTPKAPPEEVHDRDGKLIARLHPGRGARDERLVLGLNRFDVILPNTEIRSSSVFPHEGVFNGDLTIVSLDPQMEVPHGLLSINAEMPSHHRNHICITALEHAKTRKVIPTAAEVYGSSALGAQAYYTLEGKPHSIASYFKVNGASAFGVYYQGSSEEAAYKWIGKGRDEVFVGEKPEVTVEAGVVSVKRGGCEYKFDAEIDVDGMLKNISNNLLKKLNVLDL